MGSAVILVARFRRGNVALYRLNRSPYGTYIAPNVINNFCICKIGLSVAREVAAHARTTADNIIFVALVYPCTYGYDYCWLAKLTTFARPDIFIDAYRLVDDVRDTPIWMCLVFLALFLALWVRASARPLATTRSRTGCSTLSGELRSLPTSRARLSAAGRRRRR